MVKATAAARLKLESNRVLSRPVATRLPATRANATRANAVTSHAGDGRKRRSRDMQKKIVDALLMLVGSGNVSPSAEQVSKAAGVGLRSVFRHFKDMENLYREASAQLAAQLELAAREPFTATDWHGQLFELIERRSKIYERLAPYLRAEQVHRAGSPVLQAAHAEFVAVLRRILVERFPMTMSISTEALEAIDLLVSFEAWQRLRHEQRLGIGQARQVLRASLAAILAPRVRPSV